MVSTQESRFIPGENYLQTHFLELLISIFAPPFSSSPSPLLYYSPLLPPPKLSSSFLLFILLDLKLSNFFNLQSIISCSKHLVLAEKTFFYSPYRKWNFPMTRSICLAVGLLVGLFPYPVVISRWLTIHEYYFY